MEEQTKTGLPAKAPSRQDETLEVLPRSEVIRRFEIDCGDGILFAGGTWHPGGEYIQKLVVKNCSTRMQKIKYCLPKSKFFMMAFPELISLSPGTSAVIDVVFRPVELEEYDDSIYITVYTILNGRKEGGGGFHIPVIARLAKLDVTIPKGIDFGFCPTKEVTSRTFTMTNSGQLRLQFQWNIPNPGHLGSPFKVEPMTGEIEPGKSCEVTASLFVESGVVLVATLFCHYKEIEGAERTGVKSMKISGIGKFPHIAASESQFNFGEIQIGTNGTEDAPSQKEFVIRNQSLVPASYEIIPIEQDHDPVFFFSTTKGKIPPESELKVNVTYVPMSNGAYSCDNFKVATPGGNSLMLTCSGKAIGPPVSVSIRAVAKATTTSKVLAFNFGDVEVGKTESRSLSIENHGNGPAYFSFIVEDKGIFFFDMPQGKISPKLQQTVTIFFKPTEPINYYKRVFCLIKDQAPFCIDLLGTAFDEKTRPAPMRTAHVYAKRRRQEKGYGNLSPEELDELLQKEGASLFASPDDPQQPESATQRRTLTRSGEALVDEAELCHEFYIESTDSSKEISLSQTELDFGGNLFGKLVEKKSIVLTNHTNTKITCCWNIPESDDDDDIPDFEVIPKITDVAPGKSLEFKVIFRPSQENFFYGQEIEVYCYHKSNRNFRLVNPQTLTPPWCLPVRVLGHTFGPRAEHFLPKVSLMVRNNKVIFPPCHVGDSVFQTIMIENTGDTPARFRFQGDPSKMFTVKPDGGMIPIQSFQLVMIRFTPRKARAYKSSMQCILNNAVAHAVNIELIGQGYEPALELEDVSKSDNTLYLKPT